MCKFLSRRLGILCLCLVPLLTSFVILRFGNHRWNKWIFIFQHYVSPRYFAPRSFETLDTDLHFDVSNCKKTNFTGIEQYWHPNGVLAFQVTYSNGLRHGPMLGFHQNGQLASRRSYFAGRQIGLEYEYDQEGMLRIITGTTQNAWIRYYFEVGDDELIVYKAYAYSATDECFKELPDREAYIANCEGYRDHDAKELLNSVEAIVHLYARANGKEITVKFLPEVGKSQADETKK